MDTKKYLSLAFENQEGKTVSLRVPKVKDGVTPEEVKAAAKTILDANVFETSGGSLTKLKAAKVTNTQVTEIKIAE